MTIKQNIRKEILNKKNYTCKNCKRYFRNYPHLLHIHHKDKNWNNNNPDNLLCVCINCHHKIHKRDLLLNLKEIKEYYKESSDEIKKKIENINLQLKEIINQDENP